MRDIGLVLFFLACVPFMLKRPSLGVVMWVWLSVMNPHRLTYGLRLRPAVRGGDRGHHVHRAAADEGRTGDCR